MLHGSPFDAWFLVAEYPEGYCVIDSLIDPEWPRGGYISADFTFGWSKTAENPAKLETFAHMAYHEPMDEDEVEHANPAFGGEDGIDVAYHGCFHYRFEVRDGRFQRVLADWKERPCKRNRGAPRFHIKAEPLPRESLDVIAPR
jgi:hypothetical protein